MRAIWTMGMLLALGGCGGGAEPVNEAANVQNVAAPAPGPTLGGVELEAPIRAAGAAPVWTLDLAPGSILFTDPLANAGKPADFYPVSPQLEGDQAIFPTQTPAGERVTIVLTATRCRTTGQADDGQPLTAEVTIGARVLRGCAGPVAPEAEAPGNATADNAAG